MATFADNSVANFFFTRHGDQNGRSLERCDTLETSPNCNINKDCYCIHNFPTMEVILLPSNFI